MIGISFLLFQMGLFSLNKIIKRINNIDYEKTVGCRSRCCISNSYSNENSEMSDSYLSNYH